MKIDGVLGGKNKGIAKQLSHERKAEATLKDAAAKYGDEENEGKFLCFVSEATVEKINSSPAGKPFRGRYENNSYRAKGKCTVHFRERATNRIKPTKKAEFTIVFKDCLDHIGLPDTDLESYSFRFI